MRYRLMATYRGVPYEAAVGPTGGDVVLFAACPPPEELGFEPATGHWRKQVIWAEVDGLWESRPVGIFGGEPCILLDDLGERLHIAYLGTDADRAARLGYWQVDRGVFELLAPREEVTSLTEERVDRPLRFASRAAAGPPAGGAASAPPLRPTYPYGAPGWPSPPPPRQDFAPDGHLQDGHFQDRHFNGAHFPGNGIPDGQVNGVRPPDPAPATGRFDSAAFGGDDGRPARENLTEDHPAGQAPAGPVPDQGPASAVPDQAPANGRAGGERGRGPDQPGGRSARRQRVTTRDIFCELADLAGIPRNAYALEAEVDGAMCLLAHGDGFEVFVAVDGARHEVRTFAEEEAAYFYLFGVLVAEAIRNGALLPAPGAPAYSER